MKKNVLILCTGNSCRSQMAEGIWNAIAGKTWSARSAGSRPAGFVHPLAIEVMREIGIDISGHTSKPLDRVRDRDYDLVITVCDNAKEACPTFPGANTVLHWPFHDPAEATGNHAERLKAFRRVRDEIAARIKQYLGVDTGS